MDAGEIVQVGEPPEIYEHPKSRFVADFIGSVNMFEGRVTIDEPDYIHIASPEVGGEIHIGHGVSCRLNQQMWYAIRPEKVRLSREKPEGVQNAFRGMVEEVGYMGSLSIYRVRLATGKMISATQANTSRQDIDAITWDEEVWVSWGDTSGVVLAQ
jgi:putrescine transport system ATP-binding protein